MPSAAVGIGILGLYALGLHALAAGERAGAHPGRRDAAPARVVACLAVVVFGIKVLLDK